MTSATYELETVDALPERFRKFVPSLIERQNIPVGNTARLCVIVNGASYIAPWVLVVEAKAADGYIGEVGGFSNSPDWYAYGTRVAFTADNVVEL